MNRFTLAGLMSAVIFTLVLLGAPPAQAQVAAQDSVLLDPFDPVPEIQFRHFGGNGCWDDCGGYRDCDGCGGCQDGCARPLLQQLLCAPPLLRRLLWTRAL